MMKVVDDVTLIRKHLNIADMDEESSTAGPPKEPTRTNKDVESFATADDMEEKEEEVDAADFATSDDENDV